MYYGHNLRSNLQEWRNRLFKSNYNNLDDNYRFFLGRLSSNGLIKSILQTAIDNLTISQEEIDKYQDNIFSYGRSKKMKFKNEEEAAAVLFQLNSFFLEKQYDGRVLLGNLSGENSFNEKLDDFLENYIEPIANYIHDKIDEANFVLYLLEKYKKRTEWFLHKGLSAKYKEATQNYEQIFEDDLRLYLFDQGVEYPFSTPKSSSGRTDIVGLLDTKTPLILEIKIFDSEKSYRKNRIIDGFGQIVRYSNDYNKNVGYLVVFNVDNIEIEIRSEDSDNNFPNKVIFNNKVYYIVIVNLNFDISASKSGQIKFEIITKDELTKETRQD